MRLTTALIAGMALLAATQSSAAPACREKGKFVKCPPPIAAKPGRCKDVKGKFIKCGMPGAKPM